MSSTSAVPTTIVRGARTEPDDRSRFGSDSIGRIGVGRLRGRAGADEGRVSAVAARSSAAANSSIEPNRADDSFSIAFRHIASQAGANPGLSVEGRGRGANRI
jgi:hypothetical protein